MGMSKVMHQMSATAERAGVARGEALRDSVSDETQGTTHEAEGTGSGLLLQALTSVTDRRNGATDVRRNGATNSS